MYKKTNTTFTKFKVSVQKLQEFGGWLTASRSYQNGGRSLASVTILAFKSQIN